MTIRLGALLVATVGLAAGCKDDASVQLTGASRAYDAIAYHLDGDWDWDSQTLTASETITLDTTSSGPIVELDAAVAVTRVHAGDRDLVFALDGSAHTLAVDLTPLGGSGAFTVEYTAKVGGALDQQQDAALIATSSTSADPVQSRVVYTDSEPNRADLWLVVKLDPSDRALWSVSMAIPPDEDMVANGARGSDATLNGKKVVSYALDKPIPPYLMAFAAGELDHTDRPAQDGLVPLSVWYRRGLVLDPELTLDEVASAMTTFDALIMPYPWDTYSVVLLPYSGGMENATITFNDETSGQSNTGLSLNAHELSHHWFGDWVTMATYDDVWFKEGMATVLEVEAERAFRDREARGRLWGIHYTFTPDDAIVDDRLAGLAKYTTGPYERAAWLITQIRATVGETAFWNGLRGMLAAHALGSVTGEQFIRSFSLDEATVQKLLAALPAKGTPALALSTTTDDAGAHVTLMLDDPAGTMIAPIELAVIDATGSATPASVAPGAPVTVVVPPGGYLGVDEGDVHPPWQADFGTSSDVDPSEVPAATAAAPVLAAFASRSAAQQERASLAGLLPIADPSELADYLDSLDSDLARDDAVIAACAQGDAWQTAAEPFLETPYLPEFDPTLTACGSAFPVATLEPELVAALADGSAAADARLEYLLSFDYGADTANVMTMVESTANSLWLREIAAYRLQSADAARLRGRRDKQASVARPVE